MHVLPRSRISVGAKLWLINGLLTMAVVVTIALAWNTIEHHDKSADRLSSLRMAHWHQRSAKLSHEGVHAEVESGLVSADVAEDRTGERVSKVGDEAERMRRHIQDSLQSQLPEDIKHGHGRLRPTADAYIALALSLAARGQTDGLGALAQGSSYRKAHEELANLLAVQARLIEQRLTEAEEEVRSQQDALKQRLTTLGALVILATCTLVFMIAHSVRVSLQGLSAVARRIAAGDLSVRNEVKSHDEIGELSNAINKMAESLEGMIDQLRTEAQAQTFSARLSEGLEMTDTEGEVRGIVAKAMQSIAPEMPMEVHLTDVQRTSLSVAVSHPAAGAAGCPVDSPAQCIAVRRGKVQIFDDSLALNACPLLQRRLSGPLSAVCVPLVFMGRSLGVLHAAQATGIALRPETVERLTTLGMQTGNRIGTLRAFRRTQQQANSDALTGLHNRRHLTEIANALVDDGQLYSVVMADIDHFKKLNDTLGHDGGDRALRLFADLLRRAAGEHGHAARWGGEEFMLLLPGIDASQGNEVASAVQHDLAHAARGPLPEFTASFGVADSSMADQFDAVVSIADSALYMAKAAGRNRVMVGAPDQGGRASSALSAAIKLGEAEAD